MTIHWIILLLAYLLMTFFSRKLFSDIINVDISRLQGMTASQIRRYCWISGLFWPVTIWTVILPAVAVSVLAALIHINRFLSKGDKE